jgi:hypothetical protein
MALAAAPLIVDARQTPSNSQKASDSFFGEGYDTSFSWNSLLDEPHAPTEETLRQDGSGGLPSGTHSKASDNDSDRDQT